MHPRLPVAMVSAHPITAEEGVRPSDRNIRPSDRNEDARPDHRGAESRQREGGRRGCGTRRPNPRSHGRELRLFQPEWEAIGPKGRKAWLLKFQDWVLDNAEHVADVVQ